MRNNIEDAITRMMRLQSGVFGYAEQVLSAGWSIPLEGAVVQTFDPGGVDRILTLPSLSEARARGRYFIICNIGTGGTLQLVTSAGAAVADVAEGECVLIVAGRSVWMVIGDATTASVGYTEPTIVTTASATLAGDSSGALISRAAPATTTIILPLIADREHLQPVRIVDVSSAIGGAGHTITVQRQAPDTVMGEVSTTLFSSASGPGAWAGTQFWPSPTLGMWYIA